MSVKQSGTRSAETHQGQRSLTRTNRPDTRLLLTETPSFKKVLAMQEPSTQDIKAHRIITDVAREAVLRMLDAGSSEFGCSAQSTLVRNGVNANILTVCEPILAETQARSSLLAFELDIGTRSSRPAYNLDLNDPHFAGLFSYILDRM